MIDNLAWMHNRIRKCNFAKLAPLHEAIEKDFERYYDKVYGLDGKSAVTIKRYFNSWKLRGHDPALLSFSYNKGNEKEYKIDNQNPKFNFLEYSRYHYNPEYGTDLSSVSVELYYKYHYDTKAKIMGTRNIKYDISDDYIDAVEQLQLVLQKEIADKHIGIETNPSSNLLISSIERYDEHPIQNLHPLKNKNGINNFISINTDDKGVFNTSIENEFALMARAVETQKDAEGNPVYSQHEIYEWLEDIRKMGLEMSFRK